MAIINSVVLIGHLTRDAEIRFFSNGNAIVKFSIAQNRKKKQGDSYIDEAQFFECSYGGKGAEGLHKYLVKGKQVGVQGELGQDRWQQDGQARSKTFVRCFEVQLLGGHESVNPPSQPDHEPRSEQFEDDIPF